MNLKNWNWAKSIIDSFRSRETSRERFINQWDAWQKYEGIDAKGKIAIREQTNAL